MATNFNYEKEKQRIREELESGKFDIEVLGNNGVDYPEIEQEDFVAFQKHLESDEANKLSAEVFGK